MKSFLTRTFGELVHFAAAPAFAATPKLGYASIATANTARDGSGTIADIHTGASGGTKLPEVVLKATDNPADSVVTLFIHDGTGYRLFDEVDLGDPAAASTTVVGYRLSKTYDNLILPSTSYKLAGAITVALTAGVINAFTPGAADF